MEEYPAELAPTSSDTVARTRNAKIIAHLRAAAHMLEIAQQADPDLPEVMSVGVTLDEVTVQPWKPGAPVSALGSFEPLMTGPIDRRAYPLVLSGAQQMSMITTSGMVDGVRVTVSAATHRDTPVDGFLGITETTVAAIAGEETPVDDPGDSLVLQAKQEEEAAAIEAPTEVVGEPDDAVPAVEAPAAD